MKRSVIYGAAFAAALSAPLFSATADSCTGGVCSLSQPPAKPKKLDHLNTFQMKTIVEAGNSVILDARSGKYDDGYRIPGAKSLNRKSSAEEIAAVIPSKETPVVTYCGNLQCPASNMLAEHLQKLGYTNVKEYPEGIAGWRAAGGAVEKAK